MLAAIFGLLGRFLLRFSFGLTFSNAATASLKSRGKRETGFSFVVFFFLFHSHSISLTFTVGREIVKQKYIKMLEFMNELISRPTVKVSDIL